MQDCQPHQPYRKLTRYISRIKGPSTLAALFSHMWPRFCGGDIYSRRKPLFSSFGEHTAVCGSSVRQAVARPRHRQSVCIHNRHVALVCSGPPQKRGHLWLNKVASVLGPLKSGNGTFKWSENGLEMAY